MMGADNERKSMSSYRFAKLSRAYALCALVTLARTGRAQAIAGSVVGKADGAPVPGAIVTLLDSTGRALATKLAEDGGRFDFVAPFAGSYAVRVERVGFRATTTALLLVRQNERVDVPVSIVSDAVYST